MPDDYSVYDEYGQPTSYAPQTPSYSVNGINMAEPEYRPLDAALAEGYQSPYYVARTNKGELAAAVYADPGQGVKLVGPDGTVLYQGTGPEAARDAAALANHISQTDGKKAAWSVQIEKPGSQGEWQQAGYETADKKKSGILGKILDIGLPLLANLVLPGSGFVASALAGAAGSGLSSAIQGRSLGDSLKYAGLAGLGSGIASGIGSGAGSSLNGLSTTPGTLSGAGMNLTSGVASLPSNLSLAAIPAELTGTGAALGGGAAAGLGAGLAGAAGDLSPLVVTAPGATGGGLGLIPATALGAGAGVGTSLAVNNTLPETTLDPVPDEAGGAAGAAGGLSAAELAKLAVPVLSGIAGAAGAGVPTGLTSSYRPVEKPSIFSATSPKFQLERADPRQVSAPMADWLSYGQRPEMSFFTNVAQPQGGIREDLAVKTALGDVGSTIGSGTLTADTQTSGRLNDGNLYVGRTPEGQYRIGDTVMSERDYYALFPNNKAPTSSDLAVKGYAHGGYAVKGDGDGRSDDIPARLSDGEYVIDAETVALLGNGSNKAGADQLDRFRVSVRKHKGRELAKGSFSVKAKPPEEYMVGGRS